VEDIATVGGDAEVMKAAALQVATSEPLPVRDSVRSIYVTRTIHLCFTTKIVGAQAYDSQSVDRSREPGKVEIAKC
jgi:hypothetical protein